MATSEEHGRLRDLKRLKLGVATGGSGLAILAVLLLGTGCGVATSARAGPTPEASEAVTEVPVPPDASASTFDYLRSISCTSSDSCVAAGDYFLGGGNEGGLLPSETQGGWTANSAATSDLPQPAASPPSFRLASVACPSLGNCAAVGTFSTSQGAGSGLFLRQTNGDWQAATEVSLPTDALQVVSINSMACPSADTCVAIGDSESGSGDLQALIAATSDSDSMTGLKAPLPRDAGVTAASGGLAGSYLSSVSCAAPNSCAAVGSYYDGSGVLEGLLLTDDGSGWTATKAPLPGNAEPTGDPSYFDLTSVSCPEPGSCVAAGHYLDTQGSEQGMLLSLTNGTWSSQEASLPADAAQDPHAQLSSVACTSAGNCMAVGSYTDNSGTARGLVLTMSRGSWAPALTASVPTDADTSGSAGIDEIACQSQSGSCVAVGFYDGKNGTQNGLILTEIGGTWAAGFAAALPPSADTAGKASLNAVACPTSGSCTAAGTFTNSEKQGRPFVVTIATAAGG